MTVKLLLREKINGICSDLGLYALNGIYETPFEELSDDATPYDIINHMEDKYPAFFKNPFLDELEFVYA